MLYIEEENSSYLSRIAELEEQVSLIKEYLNMEKNEADEADKEEVLQPIIECAIDKLVIKYEG